MKAKPEKEVLPEDIWNGFAAPLNLPPEARAEVVSAPDRAVNSIRPAAQATRRKPRLLAAPFREWLMDSAVA